MNPYKQRYRKRLKRSWGQSPYDYFYSPTDEKAFIEKSKKEKEKKNPK